MDKKKEQMLKNLKSLARSRYGASLIEWVEETLRLNADVRTITGDITLEARKDAVNIIDQAILLPLKAWAREEKTFITGDELE